MFRGSSHGRVRRGFAIAAAVTVLVGSGAVAASAAPVTLGRSVSSSADGSAVVDAYGWGTAPWFGGSWVSGTSGNPFPWNGGFGNGSGSGPTTPAPPTTPTPPTSPTPPTDSALPTDPEDILEAYGWGTAPWFGGSWISGTGGNPFPWNGGFGNGSGNGSTDPAQPSNPIFGGSWISGPGGNPFPWNGAFGG